MVLIADDDRDIVRFVEVNLRLEGFEVITAHDGQDALTKALELQPNLILLDVMMPRMDGYELTRALRSMVEYAEAPIVMVTSMGERIDRVRGFDAGVDEYITKPHDRTQLVRVVRKLLGHGGGGGEEPTS